MTNSVLAPIPGKPDSLTSLVYNAVKEAIINKALPPGSRVTEASLARQLQVSKTPVREALLRLQATGLLEPDGNRGARIIQPSRAAIEHAYEVRHALETCASRLAAARATPEQAGEVLRIARTSVSAAQRGDRHGFSTADLAFHCEVARAAGNPRLRTLVEDALVLANTLRERDVPRKSDSIKCARQHVLIARAIGRSDLDAAEAEAAAHVDKVQCLVLASFREPQEGEGPGDSTAPSAFDERVIS